MCETSFHLEQTMTYRLSQPSRLVLFTRAAAMAILLTLTGCEILDVEQPGQLVPLTVDQDSTLPAITVNGTRLHSEAFGDPANPMIVVIHSGPGGDYRGLLNCRAFAQDGYFVVFYDQRGCGLSKREPEASYTSVQICIDDLDAVIAHYKTSPSQKVFLLGQSWGAMLATAYVDQHPTAISGVVMNEPGGFTWSDAHDFIRRSMALSPFNEAVNDYFFVDQVISGSDDITLDYKAALQSTTGAAPGNKLGYPGPIPFWRIGATFASAAMRMARENPFDFTKHLSEYRTKVLFTFSELDAAYGREYAEHVSSAYPNVELVEIPGVGHYVPYFGWEKFYAHAKSYLNSLR
jgi:proline iminopeptidase